VSPAGLSLFDRDVASVLPPSGGNAPVQFRQCLLLLRSRLRSANLTERNVLRLTVFLAADSAPSGRTKKRYQEILRDMFGSVPPPASFVVQPPERGRRVALEAAIASVPGSRLGIKRRVCGGLAYTVIEGPDYREVHGGGIASTRAGTDTAGRAGEAFDRMKAVLDREGLTFGDVVRQWNYIEDIVGVGPAGGASCQNYQAFNDVRSLFYSRSPFPFGYPAATGIGQAAGGVILEFVAVSATAGIRIRPLSNPRQVDAHRYSADVLVGGPLKNAERRTSPKFERAKLVSGRPLGVVYVSGTAAVIGQKSVSRSDVESQTRTTIDNIAVLIGDNNLRRAGLRGTTGAGALTFLRGYVKRAADIPTVRRLCEESWGRLPSLFVQADICREELLVELEGMLAIRGR